MAEEDDTSVVGMPIQRRQQDALQHHGLSDQQRDQLIAYTRNHFVLPFLKARGAIHPTWPREAASLSRLGLDERHLTSLKDKARVDAKETTWTRLAQDRGVATSTLTRAYDKAEDLVEITCYVLFQNPEVWNINELLLAKGHPEVRARHFAEADALCHIIDQTRPAKVPSRFPIPETGAERLDDHHKDLLGYAARSLHGKRTHYLLLQGATGKQSSVNLTPNLDDQPDAEMRGSLEDELHQLGLALAHYEWIAQRRLRQLRGG